jgi:hypothetical protein
VDRAAPLPRRGSLDLRGEGLWLSLVEEEPGRWTIGLEAFALSVDDPADEIGVPTPLGLDLEWEAGSVPGAHGWLHGEVLTDLGPAVVDEAATFEIA